ncbi:MAG: hypothetical protein Crog4KO_36420 [Crocinitomicaceae bacterium]
MKVENREIEGIYYADDCVLPTDSIRGVDEKIEVLKKYEKEGGVSMNSEKSVCMVVNGVFDHASLPIEVVYEFKNLGIWVSDKSEKFSDSHLGRLEELMKSKRWEYFEWAYRLEFKDPKVLLHGLDIFVLRAILYGCEVWGARIYRSVFDKLEKLYLNCLRWILCLLERTPKGIVFWDFNTFNMEYRIQERVLKFYNKLISFSENSPVYFLADRMVKRYRNMGRSYGNLLIKMVEPLGSRFVSCIINGEIIDIRDWRETKKDVLRSAWVESVCFRE